MARQQIYDLSTPSAQGARAFVGAKKGGCEAVASTLFTLPDAPQGAFFLFIRAGTRGWSERSPPP